MLFLLRFKKAKLLKRWYIKLPILAVILTLIGYTLSLAHSPGSDKRSITYNSSPLKKKGITRTHPTVPTETDVLPAIKPSARPIPEGQPAKLVWRVPVKERAVFITIDDGWYPNQGVLDLMQKYHLPLTAFLIQRAAEEHEAYWHDFVKSGGTIEDHTLSHPFLTHVSTAHWRKTKNNQTIC